MSHLIVEVPKILPLIGNWLYVVADNWIEEDILYLPNDSYSAAHKIQILKCGVPPDEETWQRYEDFKIIGTFDTYEEARTSLPRVEAGLPILNQDNSGRGKRVPKRKKLNIPGESTTEIDSEDESLSPPKKSAPSKGKTIKKSSHANSANGMATSTLLPIPPRALLVSKQSSNASPSTKKVIAAASTSKRGSSTSDKRLSSNAVVISSNSSQDASSPVHMSSQQSFQPEDSSSRVDMQIQQSIQSGNSDDSYGTHQFEHMHPQFNYNGGHYNWGMQQPYGNYNSHLMNSSYQTPSTVPEFPSQQNIGAITSYRPKESHHLQLHAESSSGPSTFRDSSSYYATDSSSFLPIPRKVNHDKEKYFSDLAKINEKLSIIDKKINPVDECIEEIDEGIASLPLKNLEELEAFEKMLKKDENLKKLIVRKIRLLGKKNSKNSEGDYVQRAWRTVFEDSLSKDVNWLGRRDKRVNGGMGKKGIHSCRITELVRVGIISNSKFKDLEKEVFVAETKSYLHNAKGRFVAEQAKLAAEDNSSDSN